MISMVKIYNSDERALSYDEAIAVAQEMARQAVAAGVRAAVCGGLAVQIYGFTRATHDVDFIAAKLLDLPASRNLTFGGETYTTNLHGRNIEIDWIVRDDDLAEIYLVALRDAKPTEAGFTVISPEWLVILKMFSGRGKDEMDLLWLLRQDGLVDRAEVLALLRQQLGRAAFHSVQSMETYFLEADLLRARDERSE